MKYKPKEKAKMINPMSYEGEFKVKTVNGTKEMGKNTFFCIYFKNGRKGLTWWRSG